MLSSRLNGLLAIAFLTLVLAGLAVVSARTNVSRELTQAAMVLIGMLVTGILAAVSRVLNDSSHSVLVRVSFDEARVRTVLQGALAESGRQVEAVDAAAGPQWEPTLDDLLRQDRNLALAKLRIDIERELRRLASDMKLASSRSAFSISSLLARLAAEEAVDPRVASAIRDILPVCNTAVHGGEVTQEEAEAVIAVGYDILALLRSNDMQRSPRPAVAPS